MQAGFSTCVQPCCIAASRRADRRLVMAFKPGLVTSHGPCSTCWGQRGLTAPHRPCCAAGAGATPAAPPPPPPPPPARAPPLALGAIGAPRPSPSDSCLIKGNIGAHGDRIYHVPGGRFYAGTKVRPMRAVCAQAGSAWFGPPRWSRMSRRAGGLLRERRALSSVALTTVVCQVDVPAGERWFCSTAEAEAAGWRAARP